MERSRTPDPEAREGGVRLETYGLPPSAFVTPDARLPRGMRAMSGALRSSTLPIEAPLAERVDAGHCKPALIHWRRLTTNSSLPVDESSLTLFVPPAGLAAAFAIAGPVTMAVGAEVGKRHVGREFVLLGTDGNECTTPAVKQAMLAVRRQKYLPEAKRLTEVYVQMPVAPHAAGVCYSSFKGDLPSVCTQVLATPLWDASGFKVFTTHVPQPFGSTLYMLANNETRDKVWLGPTHDDPTEEQPATVHLMGACSTDMPRAFMTRCCAETYANTLLTNSTLDSLLPVAPSTRSVHGFVSCDGAPSLVHVPIYLQPATHTATLGQVIDGLRACTTPIMYAIHRNTEYMGVYDLTDAEWADLYGTQQYVLCVGRGMHRAGSAGMPTCTLRSSPKTNSSAGAGGKAGAEVTYKRRRD